MSGPVSGYLDVLRILAALIVFAEHASKERFGGAWLSPVAGYGIDAVMIFFVLSGFLIAYTADQRNRSLEDYSIARLARLYSVALPALICTFLLDQLGRSLDPTLYDGFTAPAHEQFWNFLAGALFLNETWFNSLRPFSNSPYWSLGYEFWYYALFGAAVYLRRGHMLLASTLIVLVVGPKILLLFPIWLFGAGLYRFCISMRLSLWLAWALFLGAPALLFLFYYFGLSDLILRETEHLFGTSLYQQLKWSKYFIASYVVGFLVGLNILGFMALAERLKCESGALIKAVNYLAGYSFSLYLMHFPMLLFFGALISSWLPDPARNLAIIACSLVSIWIFGHFTEQKKHVFKRAVQNTLYGLKYVYRTAILTRKI